MSPKLEIQHIYHAGHIISDGETNLLFDPVLKSSFYPSLESYPKVKFDYNKLTKKKFSAVFISHFHEDHFSLESLDLLDRSTKIYFYSEIEEYRLYLSSIGFENVQLIFGEFEVSVGNFVISNVGCNSAEIETGFLIRHEDTKILNLVDCVVEKKHGSELKKHGKIDLTIFPFQNSQEVQMFNSNSGTGFDFNNYKKKFDFLKEIQCENLVLGSCQFKFSGNSWQNLKFFPISRERFERDLTRSLGKKNILTLRPAEILSFEKNRVLKSRRKLDFVKQISNEDKYDWDPFWTEQKTATLSEMKVGAEKQNVFHKKFIKQLKDYIKSKENFSIAKLSPTWSLEICLNKNKSLFYQMDFDSKMTGEARFKLKSGQPQVADVFTRIDLRLLYLWATGQISQICFYMSGGISFGGLAYDINLDQSVYFSHKHCPASDFILNLYSGSDIQNAIKRIQIRRGFR